MITKETNTKQLKTRIRQLEALVLATKAEWFELQHCKALLRGRYASKSDEHSLEVK